MAKYEVTFKGYDPIEVISVFSNDAASIFSSEDTVALADRKTLEIQISKDVPGDILFEIFADDKALSEITITDPATGNMFVHLNYQIPIKVSFESFNDEDGLREIYGNQRWIMQLAQLTESDKQLRKIVGKGSYDKNCMTLDEYKTYLISESKIKLDTYLSENPMEIDGEYFTVTLDKQSQFMTRYIECQTLNTQMTWNATGGLEVPRDNSWCRTFMATLRTFITPLVEKQRLYEINVNACTTKKELDALFLAY